MPSPDVKIVKLAERRHFVLSGEQARDRGLSQDQIEYRVTSGLWVREHASVFRVLPGPRTFESQAMAAVLAGGDDCVCSFCTAGKLFALEGVDSDEIHITVIGRRRIKIPGLIVHRPSNIGQSDITRIGPIPVTTPARTLIDLAQMLRPTRLGDAIDDARRRKLIDIASFARRVDSLGSTKGTPVLRELVAARVDQPVPGSNRETRLRECFDRLGLPQPVAQHVIRDLGGSLVAQVDFAYPEAKLVVEYDGFQWHPSFSDWEYGNDRRNKLVALGWAPLHITSRQMRERPDVMRNQVLGLLAGRSTGKRPHDHLG